MEFANGSGTGVLTLVLLGPLVETDDVLLGSVVCVCLVKKASEILKLGRLFSAYGSFSTTFVVEKSTVLLPDV